MKLDGHMEYTDEGRVLQVASIWVVMPVMQIEIRLYLRKLTLMKNEEFSYLLARLPIGMSFFGHGLARLPKLEAFSHWMANLFSKTFLPETLVLAFGYILPILELIIGILILIGLFTRSGILLGLIVILMLIFGSSLIEQWENVFIQVVYGAYLVVLYRYLYYNRASFDYALKL